ncbi:MAG: hypothetical protein CMB80_01795 [Flammeovirgaceae bacterium]|nr:hypothetical protein [Flammeovirgaceae bacterium]|tara:strand:- start:849 stop:1067 length:219 start_codon:yes stop_codon:yes gene_type:complete
MIFNPRKKSLCQKIAEYKRDYTKEHGKPPNVIWLDPDERKDLKEELKIIGPWQHPVRINGMLMKNEEDREDG